MDIIKQNIREYKPNLKENSLCFYIRNLKKIQSDVFLDKGDLIKNLECKKSFTKVTDYLKENIESVSTRKNIVSSILVALGSVTTDKDDECLKKFQEYHSDLAKQREESYLDNIMTKREKDNWITSEEIKKVVVNLEEEMLNCKEKGYHFLFLDIFLLYLPKFSQPLKVQAGHLFSLFHKIF